MEKYKSRFRLISPRIEGGHTSKKEVLREEYYVYCKGNGIIQRGLWDGKEALVFFKNGYPSKKMLKAIEDAVGADRFEHEQLYKEYQIFFHEEDIDKLIGALNIQTVKSKQANNSIPASVKKWDRFYGIVTDPKKSIDASAGDTPDPQEDVEEEEMDELEKMFADAEIDTGEDDPAPEKEEEEDEDDLDFEI